jgi:hypothetical protein
MPGWSPDLERSFKEILYRFMEEVHCTKAALFLLAPTGDYVLGTQYGFGRRDLLAAELRQDDPMVVQVRQLRDTPRAFNDPHNIPEIAPYLEGAGTARLLLVPLYAASRVVGFVDARDKGRRRVFKVEDVRQARRIAGSLLELVQLAGFIPEIEDDAEPEAREIESVALVEEAPRRTPVPPVLDEAGLVRLQRDAACILRQAPIAAVALTVVDEGDAATLAMHVGSYALDPDPLREHQGSALRDNGVPVPGPHRWSVRVRPAGGLTVESGNLAIATSILLRSGPWALVGSVVGLESGRVAVEALDDLSVRAAAARDEASLRYRVRRLIRRLIRPGTKVYEHLEAHSAAVSRLCWSLAGAQGLPADTREGAALAGLLHDVGMRELDYDTLYRHPAPGPAERRRYSEHVEIGEQLLAGSGLDELALAVRHHHERWDGRGYPDRLAGESIPLLSRIVHVAEVFDVLTSSSSYRRPVTTEQAVQLMRNAEGQFDPALVEGLAAIVT